MSQLVNLSALDSAARADEGAELHVLHPATGEDLGIVIRLAGTDSAAYRRALSAAANRRPQAGRKKATLEELQAENIEIMAACTLDWSGVSLDGQSMLPFTRKDAVTLYTRFPWIREQADAFMAERAHYLQD